MSVIEYFELTRQVIIICWIIALVVNGIACQIMINAAQAKGHYLNSQDGFLKTTTALWIIALLSPLGIIAVGLITSSLPDLKLQGATQVDTLPAADELPRI